MPNTLKLIQILQNKKMQKITTIVNIFQNLQQMKHVSKFAHSMSSKTFVIDFLCGIAETNVAFFYHYDSDAIIVRYFASRSSQHVKPIFQEITQLLRKKNL